MQKRIPRTSQTVAALLALTGLVLSSAPARVSAKHDNRAASIAGKQKPVTPATSINGSYARVGLKFEANHGQSDPRVKFITRGPGYMLFLTSTEATFRLNATTPKGQDSRQPSKTTVLRMKFEGANENPQIDGHDQVPGVTHYFKGKDQSKWLKNIPSYQSARYKDLYTGIDLVFYGRDDNLEYDFVVAPNAEPAEIKVGFDGPVSLDKNGDLILTTALGDIVHQAPVAYQDTPQGRKTIESRYTIDRDGKIGFKVGDYDHSLPLIIDPVMRLTYSTYFGGKREDDANDVDVDSENQAVVTGFTDSPDFPATNEDPELILAGTDVFVTKFTADGSGTVYSVYVGGRKQDIANGVAVDADGNAYLTGVTVSPDFPTTAGAFDERGSLPGFPGVVFPDDCFVTKLDREGIISYSTFLAAHDEDKGMSIAVDRNGQAYVAGLTRSARFPVKNEFQHDLIFGGSVDAFITVLNSTGTDLIYSSYLGGHDFDAGDGIAIDADGNAYLAGVTSSNGTFPVKSPAAAGPFQSENAGGGFDAFVAKFNPFEKGDKSLVYSTFVGGGREELCSEIAVDSLNRAYVIGKTESTDFPLAAVQNAQVLDSQSAGQEAYVFRLNADGSALNFSTFFGGEGEDEGRDIRVDRAGNIYIVGRTDSARSFPITNAFQPSFGGGDKDAFVAKLAPDAREILYSSYLGGTEKDEGFGLAIDVGGNVYVVGQTISDDYPVEKAIQAQRSDDEDCFLTKIGEMNPDTIGVFKQTGTQFELRNSNIEGAPDIIPVFGAAGDIPIKGDWEGDGIDTVGVFRPSTAQFFLTASNVNPQVGVIILSFGQATDLPVAGDWDGDGDDEIGVFNNAGTFTLRSNTDQAGFSTTTVTFGTAGDLPIAGDFDGNGLDTVGVWRPSTTEFFLTKSIQDPQNGVVTFAFGLNGDLPVVGDWNGDGIDTIGVFGPPRKRETFPAGFFLRNSNSAGLSDLKIGFGQLGDRPVAGDWDGLP